MSTTVIKHEFEQNGLKAGVATVSEVSFDNLSFMEGLEKMFRIKANERITGIEIINKGNHTSCVRAFIAKNAENG